jgi:hypothetical protein
MTTLLYIMCGWLALNVAFVAWRLSVAPRAPRNTNYPHARHWTHAS